MKKVISGLLAAVLAASLCVPALAAGGFEKVNSYTPGQFTDVPADLWCADNVRTAYEYGIMSGKSATYFDVDSSVTVAQTIVMACRLHSGYAGDGAEFAAGDPWYQSYLDYAAENGILWKYDAYDVPISRAGFAMILGSALPDEALPVISDIEDGAIPDVPAEASYAEAVYRLYDAGVPHRQRRLRHLHPLQLHHPGRRGGHRRPHGGRLPAEGRHPGKSALPPHAHRPAPEPGQPEAELHGCGAPGGL